MQCTLNIPVTTKADVTPEQVAALVASLIDIGLSDAADTLEAGEGDLDSAQLATDLNIGSPFVLHGGISESPKSQPAGCSHG